MDAAGEPVITGPGPAPLRFVGSRLARALLRVAGWRVVFDGLPGPQGVLAVYPHTSNWDFIVGILAKWSLGIPLRFWAKDSLLRVPVLGAWMRGRGAVGVVRTSAHGAVADMARQIGAHRAAGRYFWLALAPEGTRKSLPGWRSGFYNVALQARVPLGLVALDWGRREVRVIGFLAPTGDSDADMACIAHAYAGVRGLRPGQAAPVGLLPAEVARSDTIVR